MEFPFPGSPSIKQYEQNARFVPATENGARAETSFRAAGFSYLTRWLAFPLILLIALAGGWLVAGHGAQGGGINGTVKDPAGKPVANAKVILSSRAGIASPGTATTAGDGRYEIKPLLPGDYVACAEAAGYQESQREDIVVTADAVTFVDFTLTPTKTPAARQGSKSAESRCHIGFFDDAGMKAAGFSGSVDPSGYSAPASAQTRSSLVEGAADLRKQADTLVRDERAPAAGHERQGDRSLALKEYERAFQMVPSEGNRYNLGLELLRQGDVASAVKLFKDGVAGNPRSAKLWIGLGVALYSGGHGEDAVRAFLSAADVNPADPQPYPFLGKAYGISSHLSGEVNTRLNRWIQLEPRNARAYYYYALSLWKGKGQAGLDENRERIESLFKKSALLDPTFPLARLQLGNLYSEENRLPEAIGEYQEVLRMRPDWADAHYRLGQTYLRTGQKDLGQEQMALYEQLHGKQPANADLDEGR